MGITVPVKLKLPDRMAMPSNILLVADFVANKPRHKL